MKGVPVYIALLRAVNVGGTGKLPMAELKRLCTGCGFAKVRTYIASGNVVFESALARSEVKQRLEAALADFAGRPVGVLLRTAKELAAVLAANPFPDAQPSRTVTIFLDDPAPKRSIEEAKGRRTEEFVLGKREIYVHYRDGMGQSKLVIPAARQGTARNMNTIAKLVAMATEH
ncbi:MAG: DUF1697 domain-containing protein [Candidatus Hydrogenedens sp.]|nr:DUF1697 domain-containing protein [Candidatus Hydrogenedens sp.]